MIKKKLKQLLHWVFYADTLEGKALNGLLGFFFILEIPATLMAFSSGLYADAISAGSWFLVCLIFLSLPAKKRLSNYWIIFILANLSTGYAWLNFGGLEKAPIFFFPVVIIMTTIVTKSEVHLRYHTALAAILGILFYTDFNHPELINYPEVEAANIKVDNFFTLLISLTVLTVGLYFFKKAFDRLRDELNAKNIELTQINQEKTDFFANLAHETKTPLTLIDNYLERYILKKGTDPELSVMKENVQKLKIDMLNFLDSEKFLAGKALYDHSHFINISEFFNKKLILSKEWIEVNKIKLTTAIDQEVFVKSDPSAIDRIFNNLIDNAIKYTQKPGSLFISLKIADNKVELLFEDNGIGIKESELNNIFNPYYQISHKKMNSQGIGLGLSIVKNIVDELNGSINIKSIENKGTSVTITLPRQEPLPEEIVLPSIKQGETKVLTSEQSQEFSHVNTEKSDKRILIVEDNDAMRKYLEEELTQHYHIQSAINGKEAIDKLQTNAQKPDLILSDIMMDEMDGLAFIDQLKKESHFKQTPVIFISAKGTEQERLEGIEKGAIDYINKPFSTNELLAKIKSIFSVQEELSETTIRTLVDTLKGNLSSVENISANKESSFDENCRAFNISKREKDVFVLLKEGKTRKEIASELHISEKTVARHIDNMFNKTDVNNKVALINKL